MKTTVPFVDIRKHYQTYKKDINRTLLDVFKRGDFILRKDLKECEKKFARYVGTKYAVGLNSGFDALNMSVRAAGIQKGDEVVTVAHTFVASVAAIIHHGGVPKLVDIGEGDIMDVTKLEKTINKKTKAIMPVHLNGRLCNMDVIMKLARKHKLAVIEDAAQALGAKFRGKRAGSFGLTGCFSLYPFKMLGCFGDGGMLTTNSKYVADMVRWMRDHGQNRDTGEIKLYGYNSRLDNLQAALVNVRFKHFPNWVQRRRAIAQMYRKGLKDIAELALPHYSDTRYFDVYQNYAIHAEKRDALKKHLEKNGIDTLVSWPKPMHYHKALKLRRFKLPVTEKLSKDILSLPMNTEITNAEVKIVIKTIKEFYAT